MAAFVFRFAITKNDSFISCDLVHPICCGANVNNDTNFGDTVRYRSDVVAPERLKGFLNASWAMSKPDEMEKGLRAIDLVGAEIARMRK